MKQRIACRKYYVVLEKKTGYLVAVLPFTRKSPEEMRIDLKEILVNICKKHPYYNNKDLTIFLERKPLISEEDKYALISNLNLE